MTFDAATFWLPLLKIMWINILLSGDNAVVIALACRGLPEKSRRWGIVLGAGVAILMRIAFTGVVATLMAWPYLKIVGGLLLLWIAVQLLVENTDENDIKETETVWAAVRVIAVADLVMSLDNVVAIAAAANGSWTLIVIGLAVSIPMIVFGAQLVILLLERFPWLVWAGAGLLGWVAGELVLDEPALAASFHALPAQIAHFGVPALGAALVLALGWGLRLHLDAVLAAGGGAAAQRFLVVDQLERPDHEQRERQQEGGRRQVHEVPVGVVGLAPALRASLAAAHVRHAHAPAGSASSTRRMRARARLGNARQRQGARGRPA
jgi:YjbE family integral membrane protein